MGDVALTRKPDDRRTAQRFPVGFRALNASASIDGAPVDIVNISQTGVLVQGAAGVASKGTVKVAIPGLKPRDADIVWRREDVVGLHFAQPISDDAFASLLARS